MKAAQIAMLALILTACGGRDGEVPYIGEPQKETTNVVRDELPKPQDPSPDAGGTNPEPVPEPVPEPIPVPGSPEPTPPAEEPEGEDAFPFPEDELIECGLDYQDPECIHRDEDGTLMDIVDWLRSLEGQCVELGWHPPSSRSDGSYMPTEEIDYYVVVMMEGNTYLHTPNVVKAMADLGSVQDRLANGDPMVIYVPNTQTEADCNILGFGLGPVDRWFSVVAVDIYGMESVPSDAHRLTDYSPNYIPLHTSPIQLEDQNP